MQGRSVIEWWMGMILYLQVQSVNVLLLDASLGWKGIKFNERKLHVFPVIRPIILSALPRIEQYIWCYNNWATNYRELFSTIFVVSMTYLYLLACIFQCLHLMINKWVMWSYTAWLKLLDSSIKFCNYRCGSTFLLCTYFSSEYFNLVIDIWLPVKSISKCNKFLGLKLICIEYTKGWFCRSMSK